MSRAGQCRVPRATRCGALLHFRACLQRPRAAAHTGDEMPQCVGEDVTEHGERRCERPTMNGLDHCATHGLHVGGGSPASGDSGSGDGGDESRGEWRGIGKEEEGEVVWPMPRGNQGSQGEQQPGGLRTHRSGELRRQANSKDFFDNSVLGAQRLASLREDEAHDEEKQEEIDLLPEEDIYPFPRAGATVSHKTDRARKYVCFFSAVPQPWLREHLQPFTRVLPGGTTAAAAYRCSPTLSLFVFLAAFGLPFLASLPRTFYSSPLPCLVVAREARESWCKRRTCRCLTACTKRCRCGMRRQLLCIVTPHHGGCMNPWTGSPDFAIFPSTEYPCQSCPAFS